MMNKCPIARDLMPLCIDGAASEDSRCFVEEHVSECAPCAQIYEEMKGELPATEAPAQAELDAAARQLRKQRKRRICRLVLLGLTLGIILGLTGFGLYQKVMYIDQVIVPLNEYSVELLRRPGDSDGLIMINMGNPQMMYGTGISVVDEAPMSETAVLEIRVSRRRMSQFSKDASTPEMRQMRTIRFGSWMDGAWYSPPKGAEQRIVKVVLVSDEERRVIWQEGEAIPECSAEMDEYYVLRDAYSALSVLENPTHEQEKLMEQYVLEMEMLRLNAPEWQ